MSFSRTTLLFALLAAAAALHASPITYQMTFISGGHTGTGTLMLASPPASSGVTSDTLANQQLQHLTFTVAGQTFDFSSDPSASVQFVNGQISKMSFGQTAGQAPTSYTVEFSNGFILYGSNLAQPLASGSFNVTPDFVSGNAASTESATSPTPEPGTLLLVVTALLGGGGFLLFRRRRAAHS
jgi:hypothetical protein